MGWPDEVIHSYHEVIGRPAMPPYWALGFHQCRWGYRNLQAVKDVVGNFTDAKVWMNDKLLYLPTHHDLADPPGYGVDGH